MHHCGISMHQGQDNSHVQVRPVSESINVDGPVDSGFVKEATSGDSD